MPYCYNSKLARVYFKYPNQNWNNVISRNPPVNYALTRTSDSPVWFRYGLCLDSTYKFKLVGSKNQGVYMTAKGIIGHGMLGPIVSITPISPPTPINYPFPPWNTCSYRYEICTRNPNQEPYGEGLKCLIFSDGTNGDCRNFPHYPEVIPTRVGRYETEIPDECGNPSQNCNFTVVDANGKILYTKTAIVCPEVTVKCGETCPPETCCECKRGSLVCCYDCNGNVIKKFIQ